MGGLGVLFCIGLYLFIALKVIGTFKTSRYQWLVITLVVLIPSGDAVVGRWYLQQLCAKEGGLKVNRVVEHVEGFMDDYRDYWVKEGGYQFVESYPEDGRVTRYSKQGEQIIKEENVVPKSQYRLRSLDSGSIRNMYLRDRYVIDDVKSGEVLATDTQIAFNGGWAERFLAQFSDAGGGTVAWCINTELDSIVRYKRLVATTLKK